MTIKEWTHTDKSEWGEGPWTAEPDKVQWIDEETGLDCLIVRNHSGALCGYVGVPESHPWFGKSYHACTHTPPCEEGGCGHAPEYLTDVHGGLTFADECQEEAEEGHGICHVPEPGRPEHIWWFGFDCLHWRDVMPAYRKLLGHDVFVGRDEIYRDRAFVEAEIRSLAQQLAQRASQGAT